MWLTVAILHPTPRNIKIRFFSFVMSRIVAFAICFDMLCSLEQVLRRLSRFALRILGAVRPPLPPSPCSLATKHRKPPRASLVRYVCLAGMTIAQVLTQALMLLMMIGLGCTDCPAQEPGDRAPRRRRRSQLDTRSCPAA